jgi:hypothetical protein
MRALVLLLALLAAVARADIVEDELSNDSRNLVLIARPFGFQPNGELVVELRNLIVHVKEGQTGYDKTQLGFFITTAEAAVQIQQQLLSQGALRSARLESAPRVAWLRTQRL